MLQIRPARPSSARTPFPSAVSRHRPRLLRSYGAFGSGALGFHELRQIHHLTLHRYVLLMRTSFPVRLASGKEGTAEGSQTQGLPGAP